MTCDAAAAGSGRAKALADHESWIRLCTEHGRIFKFGMGDYGSI
jgi:hypothetical protein